MTTSTDDKMIKAERKAVLDLARQFARDILLAEGFYTRAAVAVAQQFLEADAEREDLRAQIKQAQLSPTAPQGETPRTDALLHERRMAERESEVWDVVDVEAFVKHDRQLEREISDMTDARDRTVRLLDEAIEENTKLRGEIAEAIERIADLKSGVEEANQRWLAARSAKTPPLDPTPAMIEAGAQRLVRWETGKEKWPDAWSKLDVRAARNDAERCWRSMWLEAEAAAQPTEEAPQSEAEHLRMQIGYIATELMVRGDPRSLPEIVETAAKATALHPGPEGKHK